MTLLLCGAITALAANEVTSTRVWPAEDYTRVTFEADDVFKYQTLSLKNPERLVLDIEDISLNTILKLLPTQVLADDPYVQQVRIAQNQSNVVRVVVDLKQEVNFNVFALSPAGEYQHRLVLDILPLKDPVMAMLDKLDRELESKPKATESKPPVNTPTKPSTKQPQKNALLPLPLMRDMVARTQVRAEQRAAMKKTSP